MCIQRRIWVTGRVQGVGFRASTVDEATRSGAGSLKGWVRNLPDGRVEAVFQGEESEVLRMVAWARSGPPSAQVNRLEVREESLSEDLPRFAIQR